ncbi:MAG: TusE/DsrC/DsvC family sulfur relay protein [Chromatiales bacterium]|jgi:tRNA 2-thiouridine synthesizing protein E
MSSDNVGDTRMDAHGYLLDAGEWSEELAFEISASAGVKQLTPDHWAVIRELRHQYIAGKPDLFPQMQHLCGELDMADDCLANLFGDPVVAWRIAGLPRPAIDMAAYVPNSELV